jgi:hypothetical protein
MLREQVDNLRQQYTDQYVVVAGDRPELARFQGVVGQVKTANMSGRALVQFDANNDRAWYDIPLDHLKVVDKPPPKPVEKKTEAAAKGKATGEKPAEKPTAGE